MSLLQPLRVTSRAAVSQILPGLIRHVFTVFIVLMLSESLVISQAQTAACSWNNAQSKILLQTVPGGASCVTLLNTGDSFKTFGSDYPWIAISSNSFSTSVALAFYKEFTLVKTVGTNESYLKCSGSFVGAAICVDSTEAPVTEQPPLTDSPSPIKTTVPPETSAPTAAPTTAPPTDSPAPVETPGLEDSKQSSISKFFGGLARGFENLSMAAKGGIIVSIIAVLSSAIGFTVFKLRQRCGKVKARFEAPKSLNVGASEHVIEGNCTVEIVRSPRAKAVRTLHILTPFPVIGNIKSR